MFPYPTGWMTRFKERVGCDRSWSGWIPYPETKDGGWWSQLVLVYSTETTRRLETPSPVYRPHVCPGRSSLPGL